MPRAQAEVIAQGLTSMFVHNFDSLVTKDYLDARFAESDARMDARFTESDAKIDMRFTESDAKVDTRFVQLEAKIDMRFAESDMRFERMEGKFNLVFWMLGLTMICVVVPEVLNFLG
jgi:tRNA(Glu) U13 pseudouridine synthase TruD